MDRIVIDKCYIVLDSSLQFRLQLQRLGELVLSRIQIVYLTAILLLQEEGQFYRLMNIEAERAVVFRGWTSQANIQYKVRRVEGDEI